MPNDVVAVVENQAIELVRMQPKPATNHLVIESRRCGRSQQHDAIDIRCVESGGQYIDVDQVLERWLGIAKQVGSDLFSLEAIDQFVAHTRRRIACDQAAFRSDNFSELILNMFSMGNRGGKDQNGLAIFGCSRDFATSRTDQFVRVDQRLDFAADELASANMQTLRIRPSFDPTLF